MKSLILICEDNRDSKNIRLQQNRKYINSNRWFFGEQNILDRDEAIVNVPIDNHNYRKFYFDSIIIYQNEELQELASKLSSSALLNNSSSIILSTSYRFGDKCPILLEGLFDDNNILYGPGLMLLIVKIFLGNISGHLNQTYYVGCTWNGITNSGKFVDLLDNLNNNRQDITDNDILFAEASISPSNDDFGYTSCLIIRSVNSLAECLHKCRNLSDWKSICHYWFTVRLFEYNSNDEADHFSLTSSVTLMSLGEGLKSRISGQVNPWDTLETILNLYYGKSDIIDDNLSMKKLVIMVKDYLDYLKSQDFRCDFVTLLYRLPYALDPNISSHSKEVRFLLPLMLHHESISNLKKQTESSTLIYHKGYEYDHDTTNYSNEESKYLSVYEYSAARDSSCYSAQDERSIEISEYGYDYVSPIQSPRKSPLYYEEDDAPTPPPYPILDSESQINYSENNSMKIVDDIYNKVNENYLYRLSEIDVDKETIEQLKDETHKLKQELKIFEDTLLDKNELIVRLEKLLDTRDIIIKQHIETIDKLKKEILKKDKEIKTLSSKLAIIQKYKKERSSFNEKVVPDYNITAKKLSTAANTSSKQSIDIQSARLSGEDFEDNNSLKKEKQSENLNEFNQYSNNANLSNVAMMALQKYIQQRK
ncbi:hypothetical protein cand_011350 [Cryptosporidium andersoni]|uniref:Uncharacterized protein n=1 Tax=Cryptosporidium andersoni TaxID=117008 RepID=A0A1J4MQ56_9CRYT|nr:hypothetical protein cand_011350 [Cryptosporidium andersoni]